MISFKMRMLCFNSAALKHVGIDLISSKPRGRHFTHRAHKPESNRCCFLSKYLGLKSKSPSFLLYQQKHPVKPKNEQQKCRDSLTVIFELHIEVYFPNNSFKGCNKTKGENGSIKLPSRRNLTI